MDNSDFTGAEACTVFKEGDSTGIPEPRQVAAAKNAKGRLLRSDLPVISFSHALCHFFTPLRSVLDTPHTWNSLSCLVHLSRFSLVVTSSRKPFLTTHAQVPSFCSATSIPSLVSTCSSDHTALWLPVSTAHFGAA